MSQSRPEQAQNISGKTNKNLSFQTRLVIFVLLISLVPLIIIATRDIFQTRQALVNGIEISLQASAVQTANSLDNFIQKTLDSISAEAELADFVTYLTVSPSVRTGTVIRARTLNLLKNLENKDRGNIISYALVDTNGNVLLDSATDLLYNESGDAYFAQIRFSDNPIITTVTYLDNKTPSLTFASKVLNENGGYIGILRVKYNSSVLQDIVINSGSSPDTLILLLDDLYIRLADNKNPVLIQKSIAPLNLIDYLLAVDSKRFLNIPREEQTTNFVEFAYALDNAEEQPFFNTDITPNIPGDDTIAAAFMQTQPWIITYSRPTPSFLADVQQQTRTNAILVAVTSLLIALITTFAARSFTAPIAALTKTANSISQGDLSARAEVKTSDELGILASTFNSMTDQLQSTLAGLEERVFDRTEDLQKSNLELEIIAEVAREISVIRDLDTLLNVSANLIHQRLNYYHVGIFLVDERNEYAHLQAASSVAAEQILTQGIKFRMNDISPIATALRAGQVYFSTKTSEDKNSSQNPLLPETVSEAILPLRIRNITIGALDIQANNNSSLGDRETNTLKLLADQLAAAVENAQLVRQVEGTLSELTNANRSQTQQIWKATIEERDRPGFEYDGLQIKAIPQNLPADLLRQLESGKPIIINKSTENNDAKNSLLIPLTILNQVIGVIGLENENPNHIWTENDIAIAQAAANRAALTLENARLLEDSQRRANKERAISDATSRIGTALSMENILQATAEELERVLGNSEVVLQINTETPSPTNTSAYPEQ